MSEKEIQYILSLRDEATRVHNEFTKAVERNSISMTNMAKGAGIAIGAMFSVNAAMDFMQKAADAEAITAQLENAIKNAADARTGDVESMIAQSEAMKKKTAIDEEEIQKVQALLVGMTGSTKTAEQLTMAVLDLSKGLGISTDSAARMFGKSVEGQNALGRLGITLKETSNDAERMAAIAEEVEKKWGGAAEAFRNTDAGKIQTTKNAVDDLEKSAGKLLNEVVLPLTPLVDTLTAAFSAITPVIYGVYAGTAKLIGATLSYAALVEKLGNVVFGTNNQYFSNFVANQMKTSQQFLEMAFGAQKAGKEITSLGSDGNNTTKSVKNLYEQIDELQKKLKTLAPGTSQWQATEVQIIKLQGELDVLTEHAKLAAKGLQGITPGDTNFILHLTPKIDPLNIQSFSDETQKQIGDKFFITPDLNLGKFNDSLSQMKGESDQWFKDFNKKSSSMFGGNITNEDIARVEDQMSLINDLKLKSVGEGKQAEIALIDEWEQKAVDMAHGREDLITQIHDTAEKSRNETTAKYALETFNQIAGFASQAADLYAQAVSQSAQAQINEIQKAMDKETAAIDKRNKKEQKGFDDSRKAIQKRYDDILENENLTSEERKAIQKKEAAELEANDKARAAAEEKAAAQKQAIEDQYNQRIRAEKTRAFNAQKAASIISSIVNTAVEVTKVLATPWMIPIVAGLGLVQTAIIASQPTPSFHTGGTVGEGRPMGEEIPVLAQAGETIRTVAQEKKLQSLVTQIISFVQLLEQSQQQQIPKSKLFVDTDGALNGLPVERNYSYRDKSFAMVPEQMMSPSSSPSVIHLTVNFNAPVSDEEFVRTAIIKTLRQTGLPISEAYSDTSGDVVL